MTTLRAITRPTNLSAVDWANNVVLDLRDFGTFGSLKAEDYWQEWGAQLCNSPSFNAVIPNPYSFSEWRDWANRLCDALA